MIASPGVKECALDRGVIVIWKETEEAERVSFLNTQGLISKHCGGRCHNF
jgi:hypothetical protein